MSRKPNFEEVKANIDQYFDKLKPEEAQKQYDEFSLLVALDKFAVMVQSGKFLSATFEWVEGPPVHVNIKAVAKASSDCIRFECIVDSKSEDKS